jgi:hypothetical protein
MLHLLTALPCEARPLIARYRLRSLAEEGPLRLHEGEGPGGRLRLVVAGVGRAASAAAVGWLAGRLGAEGGRPECAAWLNLGIAGHRRLPLGEARLVHRIVEPASGRAFYPVFLFERPCASAELWTLERFDGAYPETEALLDMEASGFFEAAARFSSAEIIHCLKIVSDNREAPAALDGKPDPARIDGLVTGHLETVDRLLALLQPLVAELQQRGGDPPSMRECLKRWRWSVSERRKLRRLLQRLAAWGAGADPLAILSAPSACNPAERLAALERAIESQAAARRPRV